jgi:hypothetical protein
VLTVKLQFPISDDQVRKFHFYDGGIVREGGCFAGKLYEVVACFYVTHRLQAYSLACGLAERGNAVIISEDEQHYRIWLDLRSAASRQRRRSTESMVKTHSPQPVSARAPHLVKI